MATIKSYTDIEQSRKLAKFLPLESADMYYDRGGLPSLIDKYVTHESIKNDKYHHLIPCWSLAALLKLIPNFNMFKRTIECRIETTNHLVDKACEPIDAAFEMVCWLKEHNKI
jgi:hypothetical protein